MSTVESIDEQAALIALPRDAATPAPASAAKTPSTSGKLFVHFGKITEF